jgi:hypothetical protein
LRQSDPLYASPGKISALRRAVYATAKEVARYSAIALEEIPLFNGCGVIGSLDEYCCDHLHKITAKIVF